jgi:type IV secretory pathway TraG/TraD family ATPase VirD4
MGGREPVKAKTMTALIAVTELRKAKTNADDTGIRHHLKVVGLLVSALIAGLLRQRMLRPRLPVLFAIDEAPAVALGNLADYMATAGGYGVALLLYAQSVP